MSSQNLAVPSRKLSISLAGIVLLLAIFSLDHAALTKVPSRKASRPKASPVTVAPRSAAAATAATGQTRTIVLNSGYDQWLATPALIDVGKLDNEWRVISDTVNGAPQPPPATGRPADVVPDSSWNANPLLALNFPSSRWISVTPLQGQPLPIPPPTNKFQYAYYFTMPDGFTNPVLTMKLLADDQIAKVTLNNTILFQGAGGRFYTDPLVLPSSPLTPASFNSGPTVNVITVEVEDTFGGSTGLIVDGKVTYEDCQRLPIRQIPGLTSIAFWESTFPAPTSSTFSVSGSELATRLSGTLTTGNSDFESLPGFESYDFFYSDWNGVPNPNGQFVTIEAETKGPGAPSGGALNLARVDFDGTGKFASSVASFVVLGNNAMPNDVGKAVDVDPNALTDTTMGNTNDQTQRLRVTVGFPCACVAPPSGMVSWWPGDGNANDIQDGNDGTLQNGAMFGTGVVAEAFSLDGSNDFVQVTDNPNLRPTQFTVDAWIKTTTIPDPIKPAFILARSGTIGFTGYELSVNYTSGVARVHVNLDQITFATALGNTNVADGNWHHVAGTYDGTTIKIYVDGVLQGATTYTAGVGYVPGDPLLIGKRQGVGNTSHFNGLIDEVEIFNRALSASDIQAIFNAGSMGKCKLPSCPPITINPPTLVHQTWGANVAYPSLNLSATGGTAPYTFSANSNLPPGMILDPNGTLHGKPVTPGTYTFGVTARDTRGCVGVREYQIVITSCAAISPRVFNTGVADDGSLLTSGATDPHYALILPNGSISSAQALALIPASHIPNTQSSRWIGPGGAHPTTGTHTYRVTITLSNCDSSRIVINGRWASDNGVIRVNGVNTNFTTLSNGFSQFASFTLNSNNAAFKPGLNTLDFVVTNTEGVNGLRAELTEAMAPPQSPSQPLKACQEFDEGTTTDPFSGFSGHAVTLTVPTSGGPQGAGDRYLRTLDEGGSSWVSGAWWLKGDYSSLASCYAICFDVRLFNDGAAGHPLRTPTVTILNGALSATFVASANLEITEDLGARPGWHHVCAPIGPLQNGFPPSSQDGSWTVNPADWPTILSNVTEVRLSAFDHTGDQTEEAGYDNICITPTCPSSTNKDIQNGTGQTADSLTIVIEGEFHTIDWHFDGGPTHSSTFSFIADSGMTFLKWENITPPIAPGEVFHAGFRVLGPTQISKIYWRSGIKALGSALQVHSGVQFPGDLPVLVLTNDSGPRIDRYVGNISVEWFDHEVALDQLNAFSNRQPIRTDLFTHPPMRLKACESVNLNFPRSPPDNATYGMLRYTVSPSQNLDGPGNITDFVSFARRRVENVPR